MKASRIVLVVLLVTVVAGCIGTTDNAPSDATDEEAGEDDTPPADDSGDAPSDDEDPPDPEAESNETAFEETTLLDYSFALLSTGAASSSKDFTVPNGTRNVTIMLTVDQQQDVGFEFAAFDDCGAGADPAIVPSTGPVVAGQRSYDVDCPDASAGNQTFTASHDAGSLEASVEIVGDAPAS